MASADNQTMEAEYGSGSQKPTCLPSISKRWAIAAAHELGLAGSDVLQAIGSDDRADSLGHLNEAKIRINRAIENIITAKVTADV